MVNDPARQKVLRIGARAFFASFLVLLALMVAAGILTKTLQPGQYDRVGTGSETRIVADSYREVPQPKYPVWRWLAAPVEVLGSQDGAQALVIIIFILIVGGSFAILERSRVLEEAVHGIQARFGSRPYLLLALVTFFFMALGSLLGIFEEVVPLVPVAILLASRFGWDIHIGLGMSILATGFGFSAAIANPFSIGAAQRLAGLGLFSGAWFRILVFLCVYGFFTTWLVRRAKKSAGRSPSGIATFQPIEADRPIDKSVNPAKGMRVFSISMALLMAVVILFASVPGLSSFSLPLIALVFLFAGIGSGLASGLGSKKTGAAFLAGAKGILPGVVLILMAMSVKHIIVMGGILDTILHAASGLIAGAKPAKAVFLMYVLTLGMNFFIGSATAKAFLLMPILAPLADLAGLSRQIAVQAFAFGDGFSNMLYPTNAVLLISLGVAGIAWPEWFKRTWLLQAGTFALTLGLLLFAVAIGYS